MSLRVSPPTCLLGIRMSLPPSIACMTHFTLSSQTTVLPGVETKRGRFWYDDFYNGPVRTMEDMLADLCRVLLVFDNVKVLYGSREAADATAGTTQGTHSLDLVAQHMAAPKLRRLLCRSFLYLVMTVTR
ncbi:uncharacterized protein C8Q71DRAFT_444017 [Rhodofomes roseus]|uniref:Uncharacterized protein n=1 Tax=Rhodofomes roseus TaxID=34475 RepID=A0ABQ8JYA2_9APHY|nr:uncharacterized protein C8Q71DRAFT_444017 [Rhodofomes roseus]KAH9829245.1 hypothetical protein C8Q71DRAFT_444017 [Rhodofomes roseus]